MWSNKNQVANDEDQVSTIQSLGRRVNHAPARTAFDFPCLIIEPPHSAHNSLKSMATDDIDSSKTTSPPNSPLAKRPKISHTSSANLVAAVAVETMAAPALQIKKLSASARAPTRGSAFAAGYDLYWYRTSKCDVLHRC